MDDDLKNIYVRSTLLKTISESYKINIEKIALFPIEIKSDKDKLDERLANQVIEAILSFGRSIVILDSKHSSKIIKNGLSRILPSTLIGYFGETDEFAVINRHDRVYSDSLLNVNKMHLIRTLEKTDCQINVTKLYNNLRRIQSIHQRLIYNQIFQSGQNLLEDEVMFMKELSSLNLKINVKKEIIKTIQQHKNYKITDFTE
jgi:UDP-glucose 6-dehydrogenase